MYVAPAPQVVTRRLDDAEVPRPGGFQTDLCACCADAPGGGGCGLCCETGWLPCVAIDRNVAAMALPPGSVPCQGSIGGAYCAIVCAQFVLGQVVSAFTAGATTALQLPFICNWAAVLSAPVRDATRRRYAIPTTGSCAESSWWPHLFCSWCALAQEAREHLWRQRGRLGADRRPVVVYAHQLGVGYTHGYATHGQPIGQPVHATPTQPHGNDGNQGNYVSDL